ESYLTALRRFQHLSNVNVADDEERSYTDSTTNSNIDRDLDFDSTVTSNINGYAWCINKTACVFWATISKNKAKLYKALAEKSLASAQQYLDSSGSEKQAFANQEADKLDSESNNKDDATPTKKPHISYHFANKATKYLKQARASANQAKHWRKRLNNENHYQAMRNDTENVYFYRVKSRDAEGRLTGHVVGNGLSTEQEYSPASGHLYTIKSDFISTNQIRDLEYEYDLMGNVTQRQNYISGLSEGFTYDALDRLTQSSTTGRINDVDYSYKVDYQYDINGNIINKSDVGDYSYNAASGVRPHTPNSITGIKTSTNTNTNNQDRTYTYDANGSMTKNDDKTIQWTSFNKPKIFTKGKD
ncbi:hypothetical protein AZO1586R_2115, partial [Bathymodiolus azoricus thioautotrophic gill symbiont]